MMEREISHKHISEDGPATIFLNRLRFLSWLVLALFYGSGYASDESRGAMQSLNLNEPIIERWLTTALAMSIDQFAPFDQNLFFRPMQEAKGVLGVFLKEGVDPYRGVKNVQWIAHAAEPGGIDLIRGEYDAAGLRLYLTQNRNFVIIKVNAPSTSLLQARSKADYLMFLVQTVIKTQSADHDWRFELSSNIVNELKPILISNIGAPPLKDLKSRHERADILLMNDSVYFIFYNKIEQLEEFPAADQWFSPAARNSIKTFLNPNKI
jgi:hypothetical protein